MQQTGAYVVLSCSRHKEFIYDPRLHCQLRQKVQKIKVLFQNFERVAFDLKSMKLYLPIDTRNCLRLHYCAQAKLRNCTISICLNEYITLLPLVNLYFFCLDKILICDFDPLGHFS